MIVADLALALLRHSTTRNRTSSKCTALDDPPNVVCWLLPPHNSWRTDRSRSRSSICSVVHESYSLDMNRSSHLHGDSLFFTSRPRVRIHTHRRTRLQHPPPHAHTHALPRSLAVMGTLLLLLLFLFHDCRGVLIIIFPAGSCCCCH